MNYKHIITTLTVAFTLALTACGGGSSSSSAPAPIPQPPTQTITVSSNLNPVIAQRYRDGGSITVIITGPNFRRDVNATLNAQNRIVLPRLDVPLLLGGSYTISILVRDKHGSIIAATPRLPASTSSPTAFNVTNPIIAIPGDGEMRLIWDNKVTATTFLIHWTALGIDPREIRTVGAPQGTRSRHTIRGLDNRYDYTFTVYARHPQGIINLATYQVANTPGPNNDNDTLHDGIDPDDDNDGILEPDVNNDGILDPYLGGSDNCPFVYNPTQRNSDINATYNDGRGDACDPDNDNDGIYDDDDNCPTHPNRDQANAITPNDGRGDACDDSDNDGSPDAEDPCPLVPASPCRTINNLAELNAIDGSSSYYLTTDLINTNRPSVQISEFKEAIFHGGGHSISGLTRPLFDTIGNDTTVTHLGIIGSTLAHTNHGTISASYATGDSSTSVTDNRSSGGLVDRNTGRITTSYASGNIVCDTAEACSIGGLVGENEGRINNSYATGDITCLAIANSNTCNAGGLVGRHIVNIIHSYATGAITCPAATRTCYAGGLIGTGTGDELIETSYRVASAAGRVFARTPALHRTLEQLRCPTDAGQMCQGVTTYEDWDSTIWDFGTDQDLPTLRGVGNNNGTSCPTDVPVCESIARAQDLIDLLHGTNGDDVYYHLINDIIINTDWTPIANFRGTFNGNDHTISGLTAPLFATLTENATVTNLGIIDSTLANENYGNISHAYATGNSSCDSLRCNNGGLVDQNHGIISHSHATGTSRCTGTLCRTGGLVGRNHIGGIITHSHATGNSICANRDCSGGGLVGINRNIINASYATGHSSCEGNGFNCHMGGLAGLNTGAVTASYATSNNRCLSGSSCDAGGLIGENTGRIMTSYATGNSFSVAHSGGLVGASSGIITDSYYTGNFSMGPASGGLVGWYDGGAITNSYTTGISSGGCPHWFCGTGGLVGYIGGSITITNSYRVQTTGSTLGTAITLPNLRAAPSFNGWSTNIWNFGTTSQLPRHDSSTGIPLCPGATSDSDTSCRW